MQTEKDKERAAQGRVIAVVIAFGGVIAILAPYLVQWFGMAQRFEMLLYLISMAAFIWALVVAVKVWQKTK